MTKSKVRVSFRESTRKPVSHSKRKEKLERGFEEKSVDWTGTVEMRKGEIPASRESNNGYILTYSGL